MTMVLDNAAVLLESPVPNDNFRSDDVGYTCPMPIPRPRRRARRSASLEIWESEKTRPAYSQVSGEMSTSLDECFDGYIGRCMEHPYLPVAE